VAFPRFAPLLSPSRASRSRSESSFPPGNAASSPCRASHKEGMALPSLARCTETRPDAIPSGNEAFSPFHVSRRGGNEAFTRDRVVRSPGKTPSLLVEPHEGREWGAPPPARCTTDSREPVPRGNEAFPPLRRRRFPFASRPDGDRRHSPLVGWLALRGMPQAPRELARFAALACARRRERGVPERRSIRIGSLSSPRAWLERAARLSRSSRGGRRAVSPASPPFSRS
jgi:hypothetical protein